MNAEDRLRCERECTRLCHDFAAAVDGREYAAFVDLFVADGIFERAGVASCGHEAIRSFLGTRAADRVTRHACSNIRIDMTGPDTATGASLALMYQATAAAPGQSPLPVSAPIVVDYADDYVLTGGSWKFERRKATIIFQP